MNRDHKNDLTDPEIEWDEIRNRGMCKSILALALFWMIVGLALGEWLQ